MHALPTPVAVAEQRRALKWSDVFSGLGRGVICDRNAELNTCPAELTCVGDHGDYLGSTGICCGPFEVGCQGDCHRQCPMGTNMTSECTCCPGCRVKGSVQNPTTCFCYCPAGTIPCDNECIDPLTDDMHCGNCITACVPPFSKCCHGQCREMGTPTDCRGCDDAVRPGFGCCDGAPTRLGTNAHCSSCSDPCTGGEVCVPGIGLAPAACQCPSNRWPCTTQPGLKCCPAGLKCCGWGCVPPQAVLCGLNGVGCPPPAAPGATPTGWQKWRLDHPMTPLLDCATGNCDPSLKKLDNPAGGTGCCPPGFTSIDTAGNCR